MRAAETEPAVAAIVIASRKVVHENRARMANSVPTGARVVGRCLAERVDAKSVGLPEANPTMILR